MADYTRILGADPVTGAVPPLTDNWIKDSTREEDFVHDFSDKANGAVPSSLTSDTGNVLSVFGTVTASVAGGYLTYTPKVAGSGPSALYVVVDAESLGGVGATWTSLSAEVEYASGATFENFTIVNSNQQWSGMPLIAPEAGVHAVYLVNGGWVSRWSGSSEDKYSTTPSNSTLDARGRGPLVAGIDIDRSRGSVVQRLPRGRLVSGQHTSVVDKTGRWGVFELYNSDPNSVLGTTDGPNYVIKPVKIKKLFGTVRGPDSKSPKLLTLIQQAIENAAPANSTDAQLRDRTTHTGTQSADTVVDGTTNKAYTAAEKTKLSGIATGATANSTNATLLSRANHTGTQTSATISDFTEAAQDAVAAMLAGASGVTMSYDDTANTLTINGPGAAGLDVEAVRDAIGVALVGAGNITVAVNDPADTITISTTATANSTDAALRDRSTHTGTMSADHLVNGSTNQVFTMTQALKLAGISIAATANSSDAVLRDRSTHTGTQPVNTISGLTAAIDDRYIANVVATGQYLTLRYTGSAWPDISTVPAAYISSGLPIIWDSSIHASATAPVQARNGDRWDRLVGV